MTKEEVMAIKGLSAEQKEAAERIFAMVERTNGKKIENKLVAMATAKDVKDHLTKAVEQYKKRQEAAAKRKKRKEAESAQMDVLKEKLKEFHKHGLSIESIIEKMDAEIKAKANEKIDAEIAALQAKMEALQAKRK